MTNETRLPSVKKSELSSEFQEYLSEEYRGELNLFQILANNPLILESVFESSSVLSEDLSVSEREIVTFTVAYELESKYIWHQHVKRVLNEEITPLQLKSIVNRKYHNIGTENQILIEYTISAIQNSVSDKIHKEMERHYPPEKIIATLGVISFYVGLNMFITSLDIPMDEDFVGWIPSD